MGEPYDRDYGKFIGGILVGGFRCSISCHYWNISKIILRGKNNIFIKYLNIIYYNFRNRYNILDIYIIIFRVKPIILNISYCIFLQIALAGLYHVTTRHKFRDNHYILYDILKIYGNFPRNINFEVTNLKL